MADPARKQIPHLEAPSPNFVPPMSGVYRHAAPRRQEEPTADSIAELVREHVVRGPIAVLLAPSCGLAVRATAVPGCDVDDLGFPLALRLTSWLGSEYDARVVVVPEFIRPWLPIRRAAVIPMSTVVWEGGAIITPVDGLTSTTLQHVRDLGFAMGLELEAADRRACIAALGR